MEKITLRDSVLNLITMIPLSYHRIIIEAIIFFSKSRYAVQLMCPASLVAKVKNRTSIKKEDIAEVKSLFCDAKSSARILAESSDKYLK